MTPTRIDIASSRGSYAVLIGPGLLAQVDGLTGAMGTRLVISSTRVWRFHGRHLRPITRSRPPVLIPDGERAKSLATVARLYQSFVDRRLDRGSIAIVLGGGVLGDVAGYAAATYLRGLDFVQVPTTLLAQVDSAIGGKVGVNLAAGKNLVGTFHPPRLVVCDPTVLATLPRREFRAGLYEVVKYGVIASRALFDRVSDNLDALFAQDLSVLTRVVSECCAIKAAVVAEDEREAGPRRVLNFGHTIGHALEAVSGYRRFRHGEAVGYGMLAAAQISVMRGLLAADDEARLADIIRRMGPVPPVSDLSVTRILEAIGRDKKVVNGRLHFVLATKLGGTSVADDVSVKELGAALESLKRPA